MWNSLAHIIPKYLTQKSLHRKLREQEVCAYWDTVLEGLYKGASRFTRPVKVEDGVLYVSVYDQLWITELEGNKYTLVNSLKSKYPQLHRISFQYQAPGNTPFFSKKQQ